MAATYPDPTRVSDFVPASAPLLALEQVTFAYAQSTPLIADFTWRIAPGARWAIVGPSGSGKTTLLYLLAGLRKPTAGRVLHDGQPLLKPNPQIGLMLQAYGLLPWYTARQNIHTGLQIRGLPADERRARADRWLKRLEIDHLADQFPGQLSGGQRQRVALARLLALESRTLLLDEPFSAVDELTRERLQLRLRTLQAELGSTLILVTHSVEEAALLADHILIITNFAPITDATVLHSPFNGTTPRRDDPAFTAFCRRIRDVLQL